MLAYLEILCSDNSNIHLVIQNTFIYVMKHSWFVSLFGWFDFQQLDDASRKIIREKEISFYISHYNSYPSSIMHLTAKV